MLLENKTAVVYGGGGSIGRAIAKGFAAEGARCVLVGRTPPEAEVRRIADGRIFSGAEARTLKLVDELGDTRRAVQLAAELAGLPGEPRVVLYEPERGLGLLDLLREALWSGNPGEGLLPAPGISIRYEWRG